MSRLGTRGVGFNDDKARVLAAADIVRVIGEQVALRKKGREFVCLCPFHADHNPSMYVVPHKQIYHCFVCQASGNVISFVMDYFKMGFREALEHLAERFGVTLGPPPPRRGAEPGEPGGQPVTTGGTEASRPELIAANRVAAEFFRLIYEHPQHGAAAREVIARRGVSADMVARFAIGAAPDKWDGLLLTAQHKSMELRPLLAAGLLRPRDSGGCFDMFRNRVMFPITDAVGRVVAFGARRINDADEPKYINSPESGVFNKSGTLYGLHQASAAIRASGTALVTEGYMDTIACHQAGFTNAVATLGTALTPLHARVLERLCQRVVLLFDGDDAGQRAADRAIEVFFTSRLDVQIATLARARAGGLTAAKDPDELLKSEGGAEVMRRVLAASTDALEFRLERLADRSAALSPTARAEAVTEELQRMADLGLAGINPIRQQVILRRLARIAGVDESTVRRALPRARTGAGTAPSVGPTEAATVEGKPPPPVFKSAASHVLACVVSEPLLLAGLSEADAALIAPERFDQPALRSLAQRVLELRAGPADTDRGAAGTNPADQTSPGASPILPSTFAELSASLDERDEPTAVQAVAAVEAATQGDPGLLPGHLARCLEEARRHHAKAQALAQSSAADRLRRLQQLAGGRSGPADAPLPTPGSSAAAPSPASPSDPTAPRGARGQ